MADLPFKVIVRDDCPPDRCYVVPPHAILVGVNGSISGDMPTVVAPEAIAKRILDDPDVARRIGSVIGIGRPLHAGESEGGDG